MNELNLIEEFKNKLEELSREYPNERQSIIESSHIVYLNWKPTLNLSKYLENQEVKTKIQNIFNVIFP